MLTVIAVEISLIALVTLYEVVKRKVREKAPGLLLRV
jgi:hypothetical protein